MDKNQFFKKNRMRPSEEQRLLTKPFYSNANVICQHFDDRKDIDQFYFIPLYLEMTYAISGIHAELAPDPVWLCLFIPNTLNHPELYQYKCPKVRQDGTTYPLRRLSPQRPRGSGRLLRLERLRICLRMVRPGRGLVGTVGSRQTPARKVQAVSSQRGTGDH